ncbi:hypothetical protein QUA16_31330 [Microcoleus sp. S13_C3]
MGQSRGDFPTNFIPHSATPIFVSTPTLPPSWCQSIHFDLNIDFLFISIETAVTPIAKTDEKC